MGNWMMPIRHFMRNIPILGAVFHCTLRDLGKAFAEFLIVAIFATATFWVTALAMGLLDANANKTWLKLLEETTLRGEVYIFSAALLGPILVHIGDDADRERFHSRMWFGLVLVVIAIVCAVCYALMRYSEATRGTAGINMATAATLSLWIGGGSLIVRFFAIAAAKSRGATAEDAFRTPETDFAQKFDNRTGGDK